MSLHDVVVVPTAGADPDRRTEGRVPLKSVMICRIIEVLGLPGCRTQPIAGVHVRSKRLLPMVIRREPRALDLISVVAPFVPANLTLPKPLT